MNRLTKMIIMNNRVISNNYNCNLIKLDNKLNNINNKNKINNSRIEIIEGAIIFSSGIIITISSLLKI
jgi:hypothetical protein